MLAGSSNWTAQPTDTNRGRIATMTCARRWSPWRGKSHATGYRRLCALLTRRGWTCTENRVYRLYGEEGLIVQR
jgi:hypothetical protein